MDNACVTIQARPSASLAKKLQKEVADREEANRKRYGPEGLAKLQTDLEAAQEQNDRPIPDTILRDTFPIPDVKKIEWIEVRSGWIGGPVPIHGRADSEIARKLSSSSTNAPVYAQFDRARTPSFFIDLVSSDIHI